MVRSGTWWYVVRVTTDLVLPLARHDLAVRARDLVVVVAAVMVVVAVAVATVVVLGAAESAYRHAPNPDPNPNRSLGVLRTVMPRVAHEEVDLLSRAHGS